MLDDAYTQEMGHRTTDLGDALYIKIRRQQGERMSWTEVWEIFTDRYPGQWAVQAFPPADEVLDEANIYHLFVLESEPRGLNIQRR